MHQHIVQRLTERMGSVISLFCGGAFSHQLIICAATVRWYASGSAYRPAAPVLVRELEQHGNLVFSPFQFNHGLCCCFAACNNW